MEPAKGVIIGEKYVLERVLGQGGMGSVWLAHHWKLGSPVAIKLLRTEHTRIELARSRFEREAMMMAKLRSRHIIGVNDYGVQDSHAYIVMEMLVGEDLNQRLQRERTLPPRDVQPLIEQAARGLVVAHEAGIVHRDLKPANIFIAEQDHEEVVKLLDFGIAKAMAGPMMGGRLTGKNGESETKTGVLLGSPHYMSPEHIQGEWDLVDHRADLWALAVIAYRALTGVLPFPGDLLPQVMIGVCSGSYPSPREHDPTLPAALDPFFARALAESRDDRFGSATELAHALGYALGLVSTPGMTPSLASPDPSTSELAALDGSTNPGLSQETDAQRAGASTSSDLDITQERTEKIRKRSRDDGVTVAMDQPPTYSDQVPTLSSDLSPRPLHPGPVAGAETSTGSFVTEPTFGGEPAASGQAVTLAAVAGMLLVLGVTGGAVGYLASSSPASLTARAWVADATWLRVPAASPPTQSDAAPVSTAEPVAPKAEGHEPGASAPDATASDAPPTPAKPLPRTKAAPAPPAIPDFGY